MDTTLGMAIDLPWTVDAALRLVAAAAMGAVIGVEREYHGRSAGFRTQLLVALGAAMAMLVSLQFGRTAYGDWPAANRIQVDPARVAYGVMGGIGFLGAGAIIRYGGGIRGLTTAASLWCTAAVGLACGMGMYPLALVATGLVFVALFALARLDRVIPSHSSKAITVKMKAADGDSNLLRVRTVLQEGGATIWNIQYRRDFIGQIETITFYVTLPAHTEKTEIFRLAAKIGDAIEIRAE